MKGILISAVALLIAAGCASNANYAGKATGTMFVYKPGAAAADGPKAPVKVAVLPFEDGTEDFTKRGSIAKKNVTYNLAKTGIGSTITALTPELWAKAFADDMAASGAFRSVRFVYSAAELLDEEYSVEGTVEKAYFTDARINPKEFTLRLRAVRKTDNRPVWEKEVTRKWKTPSTLFEGCEKMSMQCRVDRLHAEMSRVMQEMFAEAREDLVRTIGPPMGSGTGVEDLLSSPSFVGEASRPSASRPPAPASVEDTIERILKGN